jgi:hypothetical protein
LKENKLKLALLVIATSNYVNFINQLIESTIKDFDLTYELTFIIFTDTDQPNIENNSLFDTKVIYWQHREWPFSTLLRYKAFAENLSLLEGFDFTFYIDADMKINFNLKDLFKYDLFAIKHPGFRNKTNKKFPLETRKESAAFISKMKAKNYFCGGFQGGRSNAYLPYCLEINKRIEVDLEREIIALWHDESHWNKIVNENIDKFEILGSEYCWPEEWASNSYPGKVIALQKKPNQYRNSSLVEIMIYKISRVRNLLLRGLSLKRYG